MKFANPERGWAKFREDLRRDRKRRKHMQQNPRGIKNEHRQPTHHMIQNRTSIPLCSPQYNTYPQKIKYRSVKPIRYQLLFFMTLLIAIFIIEIMIHPQEMLTVLKTILNRMEIVWENLI